jgi:hypothetical protein
LHCEVANHDNLQRLICHCLHTAVHTVSIILISAFCERMRFAAICCVRGCILLFCQSFCALCTIDRSSFDKAAMIEWIAAMRCLNKSSCLNAVSSVSLITRMDEQNPSSQIFDAKWNDKGRLTYHCKAKHCIPRLIGQSQLRDEGIVCTRRLRFVNNHLIK